MPRPKEVAGGADMQVWVETYAGHGGVEMPRRFRLGGRKIEVIENLDQWYGVQCRYFKVRGDDESVYILRFDEIRVVWELIMFQRPRRARSNSNTAVHIIGGCPPSKRVRPHCGKVTTSSSGGVLPSGSCFRPLSSLTSQREKTST